METFRVERSADGVRCTVSAILQSISQHPSVCRRDKTSLRVKPASSATSWCVDCVFVLALKCFELCRMRTCYGPHLITEVL